MKAVVMAGGFGTRIQPLTNSSPKPMLPILNKPMMQYMIEKLASLGIKDIVVLLYFMPEVIEGYFGDGSKFGVNITYITPDDDYGTAGAVKKAQKFLDETFFIVSGDLVTDFDFQQIIDYHKSKNSKLTITLTGVEDPLQFGVVITNPEGQIQKFLEKPSWGEVFSDTINTGIYLLEPEILNYIPEDTNYDFGKQLFPKLMKENIALWGCNVEGYWRDVGNPESYREVHKDLLLGKVNIGYSGTKKTYPGGILYMDENSVVEDDVSVEGIVILGKNCTIENGVKLRNIVLGDNSIVKKQSDVSECTIWNNVEIGQGTFMTNCVICNDNKISKKVKAKEGVIIAENCEIGELSSIERDVIIWPDKIVEDASVVSNNIIWGNKYKNSIFEGGKVTGRTNIELSCEMSTKLAEAFGSLLPVGSKVYVSRDYHKSSRMIKRAFLGGLLSAGVNVVDVKMLPSNVMRKNLAENDDIVAGVHVRQSVDNTINTEILFFTSEGLEIDTNTEKSCERVFFRESFRRVNSEEIGEISEQYSGFKERYVKSFFQNIDKESIKAKDPRIAVDLLFGSTHAVYPDVVNGLGIENVTLNAYLDDKKLSKLSNYVKRSEGDLQKIVSGLKLDAGYAIFPNGQRLHMTSKKGVLLNGDLTLLSILSLLNGLNKEVKVYLPAYAPDILDKKLPNLSIERGKFSGFTASKLKQYDFIASIDGHFAFTQFALNFDALFASVKILELLALNDISIDEVVDSLPEYYYSVNKVECSSSLKGKMMRKFMEDSKGKDASHLDGIKIWFDENSWVLMLPPQTGEHVNLFVQADTKEKGELILKEYKEKIEIWKNEE